MLNSALTGTLVASMLGFAFDILVGKGIGERSLSLKLPPFSLVGVTSDLRALDKRIVEAVFDTLEFVPYTVAELAEIITLTNPVEAMKVETDAALLIAQRSNGYVHEAQVLTRRVKDYCRLHGLSTVSITAAEEALGIIRTRSAEPQGGDRTGRTFELKCLSLLKALGYDVRLTAPTSDGGIDITADSRRPISGGRYVIQCKDWSGPVGASVVRDLYGVVHSVDANKGVLIARSGFTNEALGFASGKRLELIDGRELERLWTELALEGETPA